VKESAETHTNIHIWKKIQTNNKSKQCRKSKVLH